MIIARYVRDGDAPGFGLVEGDHITPASGDLFGTLTPAGRPIPLRDVRLLAPCEPTKIALASGNYPVIVVGYENLEPPKEPTIFIKPSTAVIGHREAMVYPRLSKKVTYEPELGLVVGKRARNVPAADAAGYILGYTCVNDASARDIQESDQQWARGKSFDTLCPLGPWIETDLDPTNRPISAYVNGERRVQTNSDQAYFNAYQLFEFISAFMTLLPGDVISTGASFLEEVQVGDEVTIEIEGIGRLTNPVIAETD
jgi:2-keto-4-pentenoate hydratase/2-oxohepta-3-ene-1,7-dioic acid hydratase in catechol pathway